MLSSLRENNLNLVILFINNLPYIIYETDIDIEETRQCRNEEIM